MTDSDLAILNSLVRNELFATKALIRIDKEYPDFVGAHFLFLYILVEEVLREFDLLLHNKGYIAAFGLIRLMCERAIEARWISLDSKPHTLRVDYSANRSIQTFLSKTPNSLSEDPSEFAVSEQETNERLSLASSTYKQLTGREITQVPSYEEMARKSGIDWLYNSIYREASAITHSRPWGPSALPAKYDKNQREFRVVDCPYTREYASVPMNICLIECAYAANSTFSGFRESSIRRIGAQIQKYSDHFLT